MYYLFEYTRDKGKSENTFGPNRCLLKVEFDNLEYNYQKELKDKLDSNGIVHKYQSNNYDSSTDWKTIYINMEHENVYHGSNLDILCDMVKKFERNSTIDNLMNENI